MSAHACRVDTSKETGSLVVCTCGFALGPFMDREQALKIAREHRRVHAEPFHATPEQKEQYLAAQRARYAARRQARSEGRP